MPSLRGVEISFVSSSDSRGIPEYPHPDGSSAQLARSQSPRYPISPSVRLSSSSTVSDQDAGHFQKTKPSAAVYIPSAPGSQFWVKYNLNRAPPPPCKYVFFRLYMNGRDIASWGVDPATKTSGCVTRSLWQPSEKWQDQVGIEGRSFFFTADEDSKSIAEDGGQVEIQVFRVKDRKPRAARLERFRAQEKYGIASPSMGLLERPENTVFYEWHLIDPKDSPYATFQFHYRSRKNLQLLNIIPPKEPDLPLQESSGTVGEYSSGDREEQCPEDSFDFGTGPSDDEDSLDSDGDTVRTCTSAPGRKTPDTFPLGSTPALLPVSTFNPAFPQPSKLLRDGRSPSSYLQRPLPELPTEDHDSRSRSSSVLSTAPSLSPSVLQDVDDGLFENDAVEVEVTEAVRYTRLDGKPQDIVVSISPSPETVGLAVSGPGRSLTLSRPSTGSSNPSANYRLESDSSHDNRSALPTAPIDGSSAPENGDNEEGDPRVPRAETASITGPEWMRHTPSPIRQHRSGSLLRRMWSPRPRRQSAKTFFAGLRKDRGSKAELHTDMSADTEPESGNDNGYVVD